MQSYTPVAHVQRGSETVWRVIRLDGDLCARARVVLFSRPQEVVRVVCCVQLELVGALVSLSTDIAVQTPHQKGSPRR